MHLTFNKIIDVLNNYTVMFAYQLKTGMYGNRTRQTCGNFVSGILKGVPGVSRIYRIRTQPYIRCFELPALAETPSKGVCSHV